MNVALLDLAAEYRSLRAAIDEAVLEVLASGLFISGARVEALESAIAELCGAPYGVAVASGTDALILPLLALEVQPGDEVITTPFTFYAPTEVLLLRGARPVFVDIDPDTYCMDPAQVEAAITSRTVGILPVHLYGHPADMTALGEIAARRGLWLIEDMAQAIAGRHADRPVGSFGIAAAISFYPTKNLGAYGEGGMIMARDETLARRLRLLRNHGSPRYAHHELVGTNSRMDEIQAAILRVKLARLAEWTAARRRNAARYTAALAGSDLVPPVERPGDTHVYHQYTIRCRDRGALQQRLADAGIQTRVYYEEPLHLQPVLAGHGYRAGQFPVTERACREVLSLPVHPFLSDAQVETVIGRLTAAG